VADITPYLQVVKGDATPEEIAALVVTLSAIAAARGSGPDERPKAVRNWASPARLVRSPVRPSPGGWRRGAF
jgi:hypothetical protein